MTRKTDRQRQLCDCECCGRTFARVKFQRFATATCPRCQRDAHMSTLQIDGWRSSHMRLTRRSWEQRIRANDGKTEACLTGRFRFVDKRNDKSSKATRATLRRIDRS